MNQNESTSSWSGTATASDDRLTIRRLGLLTLGAMLGLMIFAPRAKDFDPSSSEWWRLLWFALLSGVALISPVFVIGRRIRGHRAGVGGMLLLTLGFGVLTLLPTAIADRVRGADNGFSAVCLAYCVPLVCLWYLVAAASGGQLTRAFLRKSTPWVERFGIYLTLAAAPLGIWTLVAIYLEELF